MTPEAKAREIDNALAMYDSIASALGGCSDGYCVIKGRANGQHTNGGCRCLSYPADINPFTLRNLAMAARMMRDAIPAALRDVERETLERAAKIAENYDNSERCEAIAKSIRSRINSGREGEI